MNPVSDIHCLEVLEILLTPCHRRLADNPPRRSIEEEFRLHRFLEPLAVILNNLDHIERLPVDRNLLGPPPDWCPVPPVGKRFPVVIHLLFRHLPHHSLGQDFLYEHVHPDDHELPDPGRSEEFESHLEILREIRPSERLHDGLHEGNPFDVALMTHGIMKPQSRPPIMKDQGDV